MCSASVAVAAAAVAVAAAERLTKKRGENGREKRGRNGMEAENAVRRESTVPAHHQHFIDVRMM